MCTCDPTSPVQSDATKRRVHEPTVDSVRPKQGHDIDPKRGRHGQRSGQSAGSEKRPAGIPSDGDVRGVRTPIERQPHGCQGLPFAPVIGRKRVVALHVPDDQISAATPLKAPGALHGELKRRTRGQGRHGVLDRPTFPCLPDEMHGHVQTIRRRESRVDVVPKQGAPHGGRRVEPRARKFNARK